MIAQQFALQNAALVYDALFEKIYGSARSFKLDAINQEIQSVGFAVMENEHCLCACVVYHTFRDKFCIGNFESLLNEAASNLLFNAVFEYAKANEELSVVGPMNGSTWDEYRYMASDNKHIAPFLSEYVYPEYYISLWQQAGFSVLATYFSTLQKQLALHNDERLLAYELAATKQGVLFRNIDLANYELELKKIFPFVQEIFSDNYLYTPISENYFLKKYLPLQPILDKDLIMLALYQDEVVAINFSIPNIYDSSKQSFIIKTIANKKSRFTAGFSYILGNKVIANALNKGYTQMIHAYMHQNNKSNLNSDKYNTELIRIYHLYSKAL
jgi:hypothetical protein